MKLFFSFLFFPFVSFSNILYRLLEKTSLTFSSKSQHNESTIEKRLSASSIKSGSTSLESLCSCDSFAFFQIAPRPLGEKGPNKRVEEHVPTSCVITTKYRLLPAAESPPILRKGISYSAITGPSLPSAPLLPGQDQFSENSDMILPKERLGQNLSLNVLYNTLDHIGNGKECRPKPKARQKRQAPKPPMRSNASRSRQRN